MSQKIRGLKFTWFQGEIEQISETEIHCLLLKTKHFSWDRNPLINSQKVGKSFGEAPRRCFVNFHSMPESNIQPLLEAWCWLKQIFGPSQNSPACILQSWKKGQGGKGESGILEKCSLRLSCLSKWVWVHKVKNFLHFSKTVWKTIHPKESNQ